MFKVNFNGKPVELDEKKRILSLIPAEEKKTYYAAKVNNRLRELNYELCFDCDVELLKLDSIDAVKVYETSLRYLISMAFFNVMRNVKIRISYNVSRSLLVEIVEPKKMCLDFKSVKLIKNEMERLIDADIPFERCTLTKDEAHDFYVKIGATDKDAILKYRPERNCHFYKCNEYINYMYGYMVPSTGYLHSFVVNVYGSGMIIQYPRAEEGGKIPIFEDTPVYGRVLQSAAEWAKRCNAETVAKMNEQILAGTYVDLVNLCETRQNGMLYELGNDIQNNINDIRLICIAGPSSSGKTTFSNRLRIELMSRGIKPLKISLDMYYKEKDACPLDAEGKPDFESLDALDLEHFNEQMIALIGGEEVELPVFDFASGRLESGIKTRIDEHTPIIIEGIHALNDKLSFAIPVHQKYKIYIAPQFALNLDGDNPISLTDLRLLRRIVRDRQFRATDAEKTIEMWSSVRRGEFEWIYPFQEGCNFVFNSSLAYELCVIKKYAMPALAKIQSDSPYYITANRLMKNLKYFKDIEDDVVPCNSLLREFIGGSCFKDV